MLRLSQKKIIWGLMIVLCLALQARADESTGFTHHERQMLLKVARDTLNLHLNQHTLPSLKDYRLTIPMQQQSGVFVTLKEKKNSNLRGCIGYIIGHKPLAEAVIDCTVQAATLDRRFTPMKKGEDKSVWIEISVLSPPQKISSPEQIQVGKHGLIIASGVQSGLLLPQVALEWGWNREDFLKAVCKKAGLPENAWQQNAELYVFTAEVFGEEQEK
jgi:AmmeMemoRadiSam system protein A